MQLLKLSHALRSLISRVTGIDAFLTSCCYSPIYTYAAFHPVPLLMIIRSHRFDIGRPFEEIRQLLPASRTSIGGIQPS
jgi:hypothetical protein